MDKRGKLYYPRWVNSKKLLIGDISFRREDIESPWHKFIYTGRQWIDFEIAPESLKQKMRLRQQAQEHVKSVRDTGI